jgi:polyhydroxyalkanoate synthesis regulator phasin
MSAEEVVAARAVKIGDGLVREGSAQHKNAQALAQEILRLRADFEARCTVLENRVTMQDQKISQLQSLFATQMVARGSGPTTE